MCGLPTHAHPVASGALDSRYYADWNACLFEQRSLLNVRLQERGNREPQIAVGHTFVTGKDRLRGLLDRHPGRIADREQFLQSFLAREGLRASHAGRKT
jgi:hypothetical protein